MPPQQQPYQPYQPQQPGWQPMPGAQPSGGYSLPQQQTGGYRQPTSQQPWPPMPPAPAPKRHRKWPWVASGLVVFVLLIVMMSSAAGSKTTPTTTASTPSSTFGPEVVPAAAAPVVPVAATPPKAITARDWAKIAKDPEGHKGEAVIVYGEVEQFDAVTGVNAFRANVDGVAHKVSYGYADYDTNTFLDANGTDLGELVQGDLFKAEVVVGGSMSYDTTMGGSTTVPLLKITKITRTGSAK